MDSRIEIARTVGILRSLMRSEVEECRDAARGGDFGRVEIQISEIRERLGRAINVLNRLR